MSNENLDVEPMEPLGMAPWDYYHRRQPGELFIVRDDGYADKQLIEGFFANDLSLPGDEEDARSVPRQNP